MKLLSYKMVNIMKENSHFGDLGLIYNRMRLATAISLDETDLAVLEKNDFVHIFGAMQKSEEAHKNNFLEKYILRNPEVK